MRAFVAFSSFDLSLLKIEARNDFVFLDRLLLGGDKGGCSFLVGLSALDLSSPLLHLLRLPDVS